MLCSPSKDDKYGPHRLKEVISLFKFFYSNLKHCYTEEKKLQFSSSSYFANQALFQIGKGKGSHVIDDVFEGFHVRATDFAIDQRSGATIMNSVRLIERQNFFMFSLFDGTLEEGKSIFCQKSESFPTPYNAWVEIEDVGQLINAITRSTFMLPDIPPPCNQILASADMFFEPLLCGSVNYNMSSVGDWNDPIEHDNPFFKWESYKNQNEYRMVLRPKPGAHSLMYYRRVHAIVPDLDKIVGEVYTME